MKIIQLAIVALVGVSAIQKRIKVQKIDGELPEPLNNDEFMSEFLKAHGDRDAKGRISVSRENAKKYATSILEKDARL